MASQQAINLGASTQATYRQLIHVGLTHQQVKYLYEADFSSAADAKTYRMVFNRRQRAALLAAQDAPTGKLKILLVQGKFTRPQAKLLVDLGFV